MTNTNTTLPDVDEYYAHAAEKKKWDAGDLSEAIHFINVNYSREQSPAMLEIGCGMGEIIDRLPRNIKYFGMDPTEKCISWLKKTKPGHEYIVGCAEKLPFGDQKFNIVFSVCVLEHVYDPKAALKEMSRVLAPGGYLIIIAPNLETPWSTINAVRHLGVLSRITLEIGRYFDLFLRNFGILPFRIIERNFTEDTGKYERSDDDLKYIVSGYEVAKYLKRIGLREIFSQKTKHFGKIKIMLTKIPVLKYAGRGLFLIFKK